MFRSRTHDALKESNQQLAVQNQILDAISHTMAMIEFTPAGEILKANPLFLQLLGYRSEDVLGKHHSVFCPPEVARSSEYQRFWQRLGSGESFSDRFMRLAKGGHPVWLEASYIPVTDQAGKVTKVIKLATDITRAMKAEQEHKSLLNAINRSMAVIEFTLDGQIVDANENFLKTVGYRLEEVKGKHHRIFCDAETAASADYQSAWKRLNHGEFLSDRFKRVTRDGRTIWLRATYNPLYDTNGKLYGVVKIASDITNQVESRHAESSAAKLVFDIAAETDESAREGTATVQATVE